MEHDLTVISRKFSFRGICGRTGQYIMSMDWWVKIKIPKSNKIGWIKVDGGNVKTIDLLS
jgi:hypothetical protein